ncbi:MAG TPA: tRNA (adenine-N1)-methyltransferase [Anaerolineae bacterium]|nr:tRNA (adenine-N1)-methyltransferase [Anaerolineae bacterium]
MKTLREGDLVLLLSRDRKQFLVRLCPGRILETHRGRVAHDDLLGRSYGVEAHSHLGCSFVALEAGTSDLIMKLKRATQIMYPKDIAYTLFRLSIVPNSRVIEAGTGSGGFSLAVSRLLGEGGCLYSYEANADTQRQAQKNLSDLGLASRVLFRQRDISGGFDETDVDALFLDVRNPWMYLAQAARALKDSGFFGAIVPTANQVVQLLEGMEIEGTFGQVEVEEVLVRSYKTVPGRFRPLDRMIAHTGYLVFARTVSPVVSRAGYWLDRRRRKHEGILEAAYEEDA